MLSFQIQPELFIGLSDSGKRFISNPIERLYLKQIVEKLLPCFEITEQELYGKSRLGHLVDARMIVVYLALKTGNYTLVQIGRAFQRDHSTMVYYRNTVNDRMRFDKVYRERVERAEKLLFIL